MSDDTWVTYQPLTVTGGDISFADAYCGGEQVRLSTRVRTFAVFMCEREGSSAELQLIACVPGERTLSPPLSVRSALAGVVQLPHPAANACAPRTEGAWVEVGGVGVDAGAVAAYDSRLDEDATEAWGSHLERHYDGKWAGCTGEIAWMPSGWGDGWYPVEVDDPADPRAIRIACILPEGDPNA